MLNRTPKCLNGLQPLLTPTCLPCACGRSYNAGPSGLAAAPGMLEGIYWTECPNLMRLAAQPASETSKAGSPMASSPVCQYDRRRWKIVRLTVVAVWLLASQANADNFTNTWDSSGSSFHRRSMVAAIGARPRPIGPTALPTWRGRRRHQRLTPPYLGMVARPEP